MAVNEGPPLIKPSVIRVARGRHRWASWTTIGSQKARNADAVGGFVLFVVYRGTRVQQRQTWNIMGRALMVDRKGWIDVNGFELLRQMVVVSALRTPYQTPRQMPPLWLVRAASLLVGVAFGTS